MLMCRKRFGTMFQCTFLLHMVYIKKITTFSFPLYDIIHIYSRELIRFVQTWSCSYKALAFQWQQWIYHWLYHGPLYHHGITESDKLSLFYEKYKIWLILMLYMRSWNYQFFIRSCTLIMWFLARARKSHIPHVLLIRFISVTPFRNGVLSWWWMDADGSRYVLWERIDSRFISDYVPFKFEYR